MRRRWKYRAFVCRYGHQNIYDLLGRDPHTRPLSPVEVAMFAMALEDHLIDERRPASGLDINSPSEE